MEASLTVQKKVSSLVSYIQSICVSWVIYNFIFLFIISLYIIVCVIVEILIKVNGKLTYNAFIIHVTTLGTCTCIWLDAFSLL